jgi:hypothetical protein
MKVMDNDRSRVVSLVMVLWFGFVGVCGVLLSGETYLPLCQVAMNSVSLCFVDDRKEYLGLACGPILTDMNEMENDGALKVG